MCEWNRRLRYSSVPIPPRIFSRVRALMLQSDFRMRTQPESQVDGTSPYHRNQSLPPRSTQSGSTDPSSMYGRGGESSSVSGPGYMSYHGGSHHPYPPPQQPPVGMTSLTSSPYQRSSDDRGGTGIPLRHRMSLLHPPPPSLEYIMQQMNPQRTDRNSAQQGSPSSIPPSSQTSRPSLYGSEGGGMMKMIPIGGETPPCKKLRLGDSKSDHHIPLRIDTDRTRTVPAYNPEVEAISPTLPSDSLKDEACLDNLKSSKDELLKQISLVDREIAKTESQIAKLKKKKSELEEQATQPQRQSEEKASLDPINRSLPQCIYAENRKKAQEAHQMLDKLGPRVDLPVYNQPSDTAIYQENKQKFLSFKFKLQNYFRLKVREKSRRQDYLTTTYSQVSNQWTRRLDKIENTAKRRNRDAKNRETFEKIFPELRKQREDKERFSRVGSRIKSEADMEEIMDGLQEQEVENKKMRSYAVIPPILLDEVSRKRRLTNRNGLIDEPMQEYKDKQLINLWTDQEKDIFKEKYLQHPKNFGIIKSYLERKSVADCVQYYYMSKKTNNYRQLLRKSRARTRSSRNQQTSNTATHNTSSLAGMGIGGKSEPNGVTTRLQREQKNDNPNGAVDSANQGSLETPLMETTPMDPEVGEGNFETDDVNPEPMATQLPIQSEFMCTNKKKQRKENLNDTLNELDTSDEENVELNGDKGIPHNCHVCQSRLDSYLQSRPLLRSQASQFGLTEDDIHPGDRVCTACRCKASRRRYKPNHCPIPTCPARRVRIKRLRPFPPKFGEISGETKEAICSKYQIPPSATKCCSACYNRINRRLMPNASLDTPDDPGSDTTRWADDEIEVMKKGLTEFGSDWRQLSERISSKSDLQCRNFFFNFRKKYGLDGLVQEFRKSRGVDGPPILTDEEESGSTTSSCDEGVVHTQEQSRNLRDHDKKDDYDTSATVSAEESMEPDKTSSQATVPIEKMKTLPNNPNIELPLQLTISSTGNEHINEMHARVPAPQSQLMLHPVSRMHVAPQLSQPHSHGMVVPPSMYPFPNQSQHQPDFQMTQHDPPNSVYHMHHAGNSIKMEPVTGMLPTTQHHPHPHQSLQPTHSNLRHHSPEPNESHEPMTVKDLMLATIERQLRKNPASSQQLIQSQNVQQTGPPQSSVSPTIQSILKSHERGQLLVAQQSLIISSNPQLAPGPPGMNHQHPSMAGPSPHFNPVHAMYQQQKPELRLIPTSQQQPISQPPHFPGRDNHPFHMQHPQINQPPIRDEYETLDLSMKKRTPSPQVSAQRPPSSGSLPPPAHQPMDYVNRQEIYYPRYPIGRSRQSQQPLMTQLKQTKVLPPPPLLTKPPTVSPHGSLKDGSITHGTPLPIPLLQNPLSVKYEGLLKPMKEGSITHGTPLDKVRGKEPQPSPSNMYMYDRSPDNYKRMSPASYSFHGPHAQQLYNQKSPSGHRSRSPPIPSTHATTYSTEQHNTSRQIIINDYYTSQQMQQAVPMHSQAQLPPPHPGRLDLSKRSMPTTPGSSHSHGHPVYIINSARNEHPYRQSPTPPQHHPQQRQGVIHRTTPSRPVLKPEAGRYQSHHDAFGALVDIAAAQPLLPVPSKDDQPQSRLGLPRVDVVREGLGKSMVDMERSRMNMPMHSQQPLQRGLLQDVHDAVRNRKEVEGRYGREGQDATLTAASLIDAIITHQINQPSVHDRQSPIPSSRTGDRLFASFQRCVQPTGVGMPTQSHLSPNRPPQVERMERPQLLINDDMRMDATGDMIELRNPRGGTWGDQIDLIISKDYASRKGTTSMGHSMTTSGSSSTKSMALTHQSQPPPSSYPIQPPKGQETVGPYISWKLRRALQHEKEQQQLPPSHPDERHIIRVVQVDQQQQQLHQQQHPHSRPPSAPSKESNYSYSSGETLEAAVMYELSKDQGTSERDSSNSKMIPREGISPLDYVKNRIMEVMRTENKEDKLEESDSTPTTSSNCPSSAFISPKPLGACGSGNSGSHVTSNNTSSTTTSTNSITSGYSIGIGGPTTDSHQDNHRDVTIKLQDGKSRNDFTITRPSIPDSPVPMVIDESDDRSLKSPKEIHVGSEDVLLPKSHPNYEPLTDEEGG